MGRVAAQGPGWLRGQLAQQPAPGGGRLEGPIAGLSGRPEPGRRAHRRRGTELPGNGQLQRGIFCGLRNSRQPPPALRPAAAPTECSAPTPSTWHRPDFRATSSKWRSGLAEGSDPGRRVGDKGSGGAGRTLGTAGRRGKRTRRSIARGHAGDAVLPAQSTCATVRARRPRAARPRAPRRTQQRRIAPDGGRRRPFLETQTVPAPGATAAAWSGHGWIIAEAQRAAGGYRAGPIRPLRGPRAGACSGTNIHFDRGENSVQIDGPGQWTALFRRPTLRPDVPGPLGGLATVDWQRHMTFDGQTAKFSGAVVAASPSQRLWTESMEVQLQRPSILPTTPAGAPQVEEVRCYRGAPIGARDADRQGHSRPSTGCKSTDLAVRPARRGVDRRARRLSSVRRGSDNPFGGGPLVRPVAASRCRLLAAG